MEYPYRVSVMESDTKEALPKCHGINDNWSKYPIFTVDGHFRYISSLSWSAYDCFRCTHDGAEGKREWCHHLSSVALKSILVDTKTMCLRLLWIYPIRLPIDFPTHCRHAAFEFVPIAVFASENPILPKLILYKCVLFADRLKAPCVAEGSNYCTAQFGMMSAQSSIRYIVIIFISTLPLSYPSGASISRTISSIAMTMGKTKSVHTGAHRTHIIFIQSLVSKQ